MSRSPCTISLIFSANADRRGILIGDVTYNVPAPGSMAFHGFAGLAATRRRR